MNPEESLADIDRTLISIFLNELPIQVATLRKSAGSLHENHQDQSAVESLIKTFQAIIQGGKIIRFDSIVALGKAIEAYLVAIQEGKSVWSDAAEAFLHQIFDFLSELSQLPQSEFDSFMRNKWDFLQGMIKQINQLGKGTKPSPNQPSAAAKLPEASSKSRQDALFDAKMYELFRIELETQAKVLGAGLIELESKPDDSALLESLMRAAHSIKGAARVVALNSIVRLAHAIEDCFVSAQHGKIKVQAEHVDRLLKGVDLLVRLSKVKLAESEKWIQENLPLMEALIKELTSGSAEPSAQEKQIQIKASPPPEAPAVQLEAKEALKKNQAAKPFQTSFSQDRVLRITAQNLNRLMGLAGESLVESRWLYRIGETLKKYKIRFNKIDKILNLLREDARSQAPNETVQHEISDLHDQVVEIETQLNEHLGQFDQLIGSHLSLSDRLYQEVINSRMRPFADGVESFPRMVRDISHQLGKKVRLEISGKTTPVDRDILEKLESPLSHLLRNAIDHGIESPENRLAAGKSEEGVIKLEAHHRGGMLAITVSDDGEGIDLQKLRSKIIEKKLTTPELAEKLSKAELIDFLFLPGFSTSQTVSEISGRGVGLDIVQSSVQEVGGSVRLSFRPGKGVTIQLQLPLTLSVIRALLVEISGEAYAFPLARINKTHLVNRDQIEVVENRQYFHLEGKNIGLVSAWEVLELKEPRLTLKDLSVILLSDRQNSYGLIVDRQLGERELVVQELDPRLGKIPDIIAGSVLEDGSPVLIIDTEDIIRSIDNLLTGNRLTKVAYMQQKEASVKRKRILVVDDSITVREVECRLLKNHGYDVETAVNGVDGWNAVRTGHYDLIISDVDMPRMNGIELLKTIKSDPKLKNLPVMIVSYKSTEEDRLKGLEAGADYYLTKSSFHDTTLIDAVQDLIGK